MPPRKRFRVERSELAARTDSGRARAAVYFVRDSIARALPFVKHPPIDFWTVVNWDDGPCWYTPDRGCFHLIQRPDGWQCRIFDAQTHAPPAQYCPPHAPPETALAVATVWMNHYVTPQTDTDGRAFIPLRDGEPMSDTSLGCQSFYLDDPAAVAELIECLALRSDIQWVQDSIVEWRREEP